MTTNPNFESQNDKLGKNDNGKSEPIEKIKHLWSIP